MMGSDSEKLGGERHPVHEVEISGFYLGKYEVTQAEWRAVMGQLPAKIKADQQEANKPVTQISYNDVQGFIKRLNLRETNGQYRLPTEAEWEYAARAGQTGDFPYGNDNAALSLYAWVKVASLQPVGGKAPNPFGLYDMLGNAWEWVQDWYGEDYYRDSPRSNPTGPASGDYRIIRGGGFSFGQDYCNVFHRYYSAPESSVHDVGFRLVFVPKE